MFPASTRICTLVCLLVSSIVGFSAYPQVQYNFFGIASGYPDTSQGIYDLSIPSLNDYGTVAFTGLLLFQI